MVDIIYKLLVVSLLGAIAYLEFLNNQSLKPSGSFSHETLDVRVVNPEVSIVNSDPIAIKGTVGIETKKILGGRMWDSPIPVEIQSTVPVEVRNASPIPVAVER